MFWMWVLTVFGLTDNRRAISGLPAPSANN
jgi:hypothetical protein